MQKEWQPEHPLLYSACGFRYCDLLLADPERAAWGEMQKVEGRMKKEELVATCSAISQRAEQALKIAEPNEWLLAIALDHLTLGRAALYEAILGESEVRNSKFEIEQAVSGLRRAGQQMMLPHGLLTRAWLRFLVGARTGPESAQADLDEAWEIAERGPMRLFLADIHLYRARLFGNQKDEERMQKYPWQSPQQDLAEARRLIEQCGYWRRKEELEDAEEASKSW